MFTGQPKSPYNCSVPLKGLAATRRKKQPLCFSLVAAPLQMTVPAKQAGIPDPNRRPSAHQVGLQD